MKAFFGSTAGRLVLSVLGLLLLSLLVWFALPYVAIADRHPWAGTVGRLLTILVVVVIWFAVIVVRLLRASRATKALAEGVSAAEEPRSAGADAAAGARDAAQLRERFAQATAALRRVKGGGRGLYELPWYVIIGPPGTGKTTLIRNSGLRFPLSSEFGRDAVRGVGGTRNCDWWFTDEAVLLDTAGRYTTQDSNAAADRGGWMAFLQLLRKFRKRQPINGILVAFSASDFATASDSDLAQHADLIKRRLDEIHEQLRVRLPVYFMVTKCDLIAGFTEYFDDLDQQARAQVWGYTATLAESEQGTVTRNVGAALAGLCARLADRVPSRLDQERNAARRASLLSFPHQVAALAPRMERLVKEIFESGRFDRALLFRGLYLTSGTQEGTPIDRMLSAVSREFGINPQLVAPPVTAGRSYFIDSLLRSVVFAEAGLAGANRRLALQKAALHSAAYIACGAAAILGIAALLISFSANRSYLKDIGALADGLQLSAPQAGGLGAESLPVLDPMRALVNAAEHDGKGAPWHMHMGLYKGRSMAGVAHDAYEREVNSLLIPGLAQALRRGLLATATDPEALFESLKAYLMLTDSTHLDGDDLAAAAEREWTSSYPEDPTVAARLTGHLRALLASGQGITTISGDAETVARARASLEGLTPARLVYERLRRAYSADPARGLRLDVASGMESEKVLFRRGGAALTEPLPYLYTKPAFKEISTLGAAKAAKSFSEDAWVFGGASAGIRDLARLPYDVLDAYEADYIDAWDALLKDLAIRPVRGGPEVTEALRILSSGNSPLRAVLKSVTDNTLLVDAGAAPAGKDPLSQLEAGATAAAGAAAAAVKRATGAGALPAGARVTTHFQTLHGSAAAVDQCIASLAQIYKQLKASTQGYVDANATAALNQGGAVDLARELQSCAMILPPPINGWIGELSTASQAVAMGEVRAQMGNKIAQALGGDCRQLVTRYPLRPNSQQDIPMEDFGKLFGYNGTLESFYRDNLANLVEVRGDIWQWKNIGNASIGLPPAVLTSFRNAALIRQMFFRPGGQIPEVRFTLTPNVLDPNAGRFVLEIDGQTMEYRHGPATPWRGTWPGPTAGVAAVRIEDRSGKGSSISKQGPWAWFRLLDSAELVAQSDTRFLLTFNVGGLSARLILDASSIHSPFRREALMNYQCPG